MRRVQRCLAACLFDLLLAASVGLAQPAPQSAVADAHLKAEHQSFCRVIVVLVDQPSVRLRIAQAGEPFRINATFAQNVAAGQKVVIQHAVDEWQGVVKTAGFTPTPYSIRFSFGPLGEPNLAETTTWVDRVSGNLVSARIVFHNNGSVNWFVDPSPGDDAEFGAAPPAGHDLLTVARHEIAHAVGWVRSGRVANLMEGNAFDAQRLNIAIGGPDDFHADPAAHPDNLMLARLGASARRPIRLYPDGALLARAYTYDITMGFVYSGFGGGGLGSANSPWTTLTEAISRFPWGFYDLLVIPGTYHESVPLILNKPMTIRASRGGDAIITGP